MSFSRSPWEPTSIRPIERSIAHLLPRGPSLELAQLYLERAELLIELGEEREADLQLDEVLETLESLAGSKVDLLRLKSLARRVHFHQRDGEGIEPALRDLHRALKVLERVDRSELGNELGELEVELWIHLGRLLMVSGQDGRVEALRHAVALAGKLTSPRAWVFGLRARRELATALAQDDVDRGLKELSDSEEAVSHHALPAMERDLLLSTRAEMLANAQRFKEALHLLRDAFAGQELPDWALAQQATTLELAGDVGGAWEVGNRLVERQGQALDPRDLDSCQRLAEALLAQAPRAPGDEERAQIAVRVMRLLEGFPSLPPSLLRLMAHSHEIAAGYAEAEEARDLLATRVHLLEALERDTRSQRDHLELTRAFLQLGDVWLRLEAPQQARRQYTWAIDRLEALSPEHPFAQHVLPLARNALGHALAAQDMWLAARRELDEAARLLESRTNPETLVELSEVFLFRAVTRVNAGDPEAGVAGLRRDIARLLGVIMRERTPLHAELIDTAVSLCVLQAEVLFDHLDDVERALTCYDQALQLRDLNESQPPAAVASILGAKGSVLNEVVRFDEALPVLRRSLQLFQTAAADSAVVLGDRALARLNIAGSLSGLGQPREALKEVEEAGKLLEEADDPDPPEEMRHRAIRTHLFLQRGEALYCVGHPLLAADEFTRSIDLCRMLLEEEEGDAWYEAHLRLPLALLRRARCWIDSGEDHGSEADHDLREAYRLYNRLLDDEARPAHRRRLSEVKSLLQELNGG